jgi:hypothetical protein
VTHGDFGDAVPPSTAAPWVTPVSGRHVARSTACGRVRETMATAGSA